MAAAAGVIYGVAIPGAGRTMHLEGDQEADITTTARLLGGQFHVNLIMIIRPAFLEGAFTESAKNFVEHTIQGRTVMMK